MMDNVVLDTNCLVMAISSKSSYNEVWKSFLEEKYILCVSNDIVEEYHEVISRNISSSLADAVIYTILARKNVRRFDPHFKHRLITKDEDDDKFVDCALIANAKFIVTEDHHFNVLKTIPFPKVDVINIDEFVEYLRENDFR